MKKLTEEEPEPEEAIRIFGSVSIYSHTQRYKSLRDPSGHSALIKKINN